MTGRERERERENAALSPGDNKTACTFTLFLLRSVLRVMRVTLMINAIADANKRQLVTQGTRLIVS